jgi:hypothetical protein
MSNFDDLLRLVEEGKFVEREIDALIEEHERRKKTHRRQWVRGAVVLSLACVVASVVLLVSSHTRTPVAEAPRTHADEEAIIDPYCTVGKSYLFVHGSDGVWRKCENGVIFEATYEKVEDTP